MLARAQRDERAFPPEFEALEKIPYALPEPVAAETAPLDMVHEGAAKCRRMCRDLPAGFTGRILVQIKKRIEQLDQRGGHPHGALGFTPPALGRRVRQQPRNPMRDPAGMRQVERDLEARNVG